MNDDLEFEGQIIKGKDKKGKQYIKANSQIFINDVNNSQNSNANGDITNQINPEDKIIFEGEIKGTLWWTGKFYLINNSGNKTLLGELNEGNGRINKFWDFEEFKGEVRNGIFWKGPFKKYNNKGELIFDGEYKDGRYKGKEYKDGNLLFDGEYKDDRKYKGKEYDKNNKIIFDGEYHNGNRWNGKIIIDEWKNKFEGEIREGKMWNGRAKNEGFEGELREGKVWNGRAKNAEFEGEIRDGKKWTGYGIETIRYDTYDYEDGEYYYKYEEVKYINFKEGMAYCYNKTNKTNKTNKEAYYDDDY